MLVKVFEFGCWLAAAAYLAKGKIKMVSQLIANSHFILNVKNSDICVGAFTNYLLIGVIEKSSFQEKSIKVPLKCVPRLKSDFLDGLNFFDFESTLDKDYGGDCFQDYKWKGHYADGKKKLTFFENDENLFSLNSSGFLSLLRCFSKVLPFTFLFTNIDIYFCVTVTRNEEYFVEISSNQSKLEKLIDDVCKCYPKEVNFATRSTLSLIFSYYKEELNCLIWLNEYGSSV